MINLTKLKLNLWCKICFKNFVVLLQVSKWKYNKVSDKGGKEIG